MRIAFIEILEKLYNKFYSFDAFRNIYPTFEDFKVKFQEAYIKNGFSSPALKKVNLDRILEQDSSFELKEDKKIEVLSEIRFRCLEKFY